MKKNLFTLLLVSLTLVLVFALTSCGDGYSNLPSDERALKLDEIADEKMSAVKDFSATVSGVLKMDMNGTIITSELSGHQKRSSNGGDNRVEILLSSTISLAGNSSTTGQKYGFQNGKAYDLSDTDGEYFGHYSEMTLDEYLDYKDDTGIEGVTAEDIDAEDAETKMSMKREDGGWTLIFEDFNDEAILKIKQELGLTEYSDDIEDLTMTIILDKNLHYKMMKCELIFAEDSNNAFEMKVDYSEINTGKTSIDDIDFDLYTEVDDIRVIDAIEDGLLDASITSGKNITRTASVYLRQRVKQNGISNTYTETDEMTYGLDENGRVFYEINALVGQGVNGDNYSEYVLTVRDGRKTTESYKGDKLLDSETEDTDDESEKAFINLLLDELSFTRKIITKLERSDEGAGVYLLTCDIPEELIGQSYHSGEFTLTVTVGEDYELLKMEYYLYVKFDSRGSTTYTMDYRVEFGTAEQE